MLKGIDNVKGKEKEIKIIHIGKEDLQLFLFTHDMTVYIENPKDLTKKFLELISNSSKIIGYKVNTQKSIVLLHSSNGKEMTLRIQYYLLCVCVCVSVCVWEREHTSATELCLTPCHPVDCSPPFSSVHGILQARILEWVAHIEGRFFTIWATSWCCCC